jgi:integrase
MMEQKRWHKKGIPGAFYTRGKRRIIYYQNSKTRVSLNLEYSVANKKTAEEEVVILLSNEYTVKMSINYFLDYKLKENLARNTYKKYFYVLKSMLPYYENVMINDYEEVKKYYFKKTQYLNAVSKQSIYSAIRTFYSFLIAEQIVDKHLLYPDEVPVNATRQVDIYTKKELDLIFKILWEHDKKMYWFIKFLYFTAFRYEEARTLKKEQYRENGQISKNITIVSKDKKQIEKFPISPALKEIIIQAEQAHEHNERLFYYSSSHQGFRHLKKTILKYDTAGEIELSNRFMHKFRRTRISFWLFEKKIPLQFVSKLSRNSLKIIEKHYKKNASKITPDYQ